MAQAIADANELRKFAQQLKKFSGDLDNQFKMTKGKMQALGQTWRDQEHSKFSEKFTQATRPLYALVKDMEAYSQFLIRKAQAVEKYKNQR